MWKPSAEEILNMYSVPGNEPNRMQTGYNPGVEAEIAAAALREPATLDQALRGTWGNLENEGAAAVLKARETGRTPQDIRTEQDQLMVNMAEAYNRQAAAGEADRRRRERVAANRDEKRKRLTLEEWNAYTPLQQAAVQSNADLFAAIQRDKRFQSKNRVDPTNPDEVKFRRGQLNSYQERVKALFGDAGAEGYDGLQYAPNTIAWLDERGIEKADLAGKTLADLLSGDTLMTKKTIASLAQEEQPTDPLRKQSQRQANLAFARNIAEGQLQYQEKLAAQLKKGDQLLTDMTARGTNAAAEESYGAKLQAPMTKLTAVRPETLQEIDKYMEGLARPDLDMNETISQIQKDLLARGADQQEINQVWQTMQDRVRVGMQGNGKWFPDVQYKLRSPDEVAAGLGMPTLKRKA